MTKEIERNYSEAQETRINAFAEEMGGRFDNAGAAILAAEFGKDVRSVRAKASRMGVYKAKEKTSKNGGKVETREKIAEEIADLVGRNLDGLEKAPKLALQYIRDALSA